MNELVHDGLDCLHAFCFHNCLRIGRCNRQSVKTQDACLELKNMTIWLRHTHTHTHTFSHTNTHHTNSYTFIHTHTHSLTRPLTRPHPHTDLPPPNTSHKTRTQGSRKDNHPLRGCKLRPALESEHRHHPFPNRHTNTVSERYRLPWIRKTHGSGLRSTEARINMSRSMKECTSAAKLLSIYATPPHATPNNRGIANPQKKGNLPTRQRKNVSLSLNTSRHTHTHTHTRMNT